jgi:hypothetical protein
MRVTITAGTGACQHIVVRDAADNSLVGVYLRSDIAEARRDVREGYVHDFLTRACDLVTDAVERGEITRPLTLAKVKNYLESVEI